MYSLSHKHKNRCIQRHGWIKPAAIVGLGIGSVIMAALAFAWIANPSSNTPSQRLSLALQTAQRGDFLNSSRALQGLEPDSLSSPEDLAKYHLLKGAELFELSNTSSLRQSQFGYLDKSIAELQKAKELGFPAGFEGLANYLLGTALYNNRKFDDAYDLLEVAVTRYPKQRFDSVEKLVRIKLRADQPNVKQIEKLVDRWNSFPAVRQEDIDRSRLALATLFEKLKDYGRAIETLKQVDSSSIVWPDAELQSVTIELEQLRLKNMQPGGQVIWTPEAKSELQGLVNRLEAVVENLNCSRNVKGRAEYEMSVGLHELDRSEDALNHLSAIRSNSPQSIESLAASVLTIAINADLKRWQDAIQALRILNSGLGDIRWYENDWMPLSKVYDSLLATGTKFLHGDANKLTIEYCDKLPVFIKDDDKLRIKAPALFQLADQANQQSRQSANNGVRFISKDGNPADQEATSLYREAARMYERLANLQMIAPDYPELLWKAIECYSQSEDFRRSNLLLDRYLDVMPRNEHPRALLQKAENYFNSDQSAAALDALTRCIAIAPDHPKSSEARLYASQILQNQSRNDEAVEQLISNLYDGILTPANSVWRASLFELGLLLCRSGGERFSAANSEYPDATAERQKELFQEMEASSAMLLQGIQRLEEAIRRYPEDQRRFQCLYRIAESYRTAAEFSKLKLNSVLNSPIDLRETYREERDHHFESSREAYARLREMLTDDTEGIASNEYMRRLLRNSYMGEADLLYEMQDYEKALGVYRSAANRFVSQPISLEALTRAAQCLQQMGRIPEANRAVIQAYDLIARIDDSDPEAFAETTRGSKEDWLAYLDWLKNAIR